MNHANQPQQKPLVPDRQSVNAHQIDTLLTMLGMLQPFVLGTPARRGFFGAGAEPDESPAPPKLDSGVKLSVETTFIKLCLRLDAVLEDSKRWDLSGPDKLYTAMAKAYEAQEVFLRTQAESSAAVQRPSFQHRPGVYTLGTDFVALWGDPSVEGGYIAGRGPTPAAALLDFDAAFLRTPAEQVRLIADVMDAPVPEPPAETPQEFQNQTKSKKGKKSK